MRKVVVNFACFFAASLIFRAIRSGGFSGRVLLDAAMVGLIATGLLAAVNAFSKRGRG